MDEPIPIEGIVEGDPAALGAVCAAGGSAVLAYCAAAGVRTHVAETVVAALADFRRAVVANAGQEPSELQDLLLVVTGEAVRNVADVVPSPARLAAAQVALEGAVTARLVPALARRIISALVHAAPVTAYSGDAAAVRRAAEQHYARLFEARPAPGAAGTAAEPGAWVPPEILGAGSAATAAGVAAEAASAVTWRLPAEVDGPARPGVAPEPEPAVEPAAPPPPLVRPPGTLVIKRGGHWPFRRRPRLPARGPSPVGAPGRGGGGGTGGTRNALIAGVIGLVAGAGVAILAVPAKRVEPPAVLVRPLDVPFTIDGARFNVARTRDAAWAVEIRRRPLRPGRTWLTLAAQTRNVSRASFHPRALGFRLRTAAGIAIGPDTATVPPDVSAAQGRLPIGKRSSVHLGFQIPREALDLTLEFDPRPGPPRVQVPLS